DRIISMTLDKDHEVAVQTLKLLLLISKTSDDVLSPDDYQQLFPFVYSSQRPLAVVAGELLFSRLLRTSPGDQDGANEEEAHKQQTLVRLKALLQFYQDSGVEQAVLVEIVLASVRQASEGPTLAGRSGAKKFSGSSDIVASLMKIPQYFLPESPVAESEQVASSLLAEMRALLDVHADPGVLEAAACTYLRLCEEDMTLSSVARAARDAMVQCWVDELTAMLQDSLRDDSFSADEEKTGQIVAVLKRLRAFHNCHDLSRWNLFELLSPLLPAERSQGRAPPQDKAEAQRFQLCLFSERSQRCLSHSDHSVRQQAFVGVCDVLTAHSYQLHVWDPTSYGPLRYTPSPKLQMALLTFVCSNVFVGPECDSTSRISETPEVEKLEDLHRRRTLLAAYCKLVVHGVLEMSMAAEIFMFYIKYYSDFGDIIKETMYRTRQIDKIESTRPLVLCLQQLFVRLKREQGSGGTPRSHVQTFTSIKELARRFALTFGDLIKFRECIVMIHRFSYLQKHTAEHIVDLREESWQPLVYYRTSLLCVAEGEDAVSQVSSDKKPSRSPLVKHKLEGTALTSSQNE
ncbi:unnamed protein product, partial [Lampetra planeri]